MIIMRNYFIYFTAFMSFLINSAAFLYSGLGISMPWYFEPHGIDRAHNAGFFGNGVKIAIIDTPVYLDHPLLSDTKVREAYCFRAKESAKAWSDHGTVVTSIIGANPMKNFPDIQGVAPKAHLAIFAVPEKGCGLEILEEALLKVVEFKPDIINISSNVLKLSDEKISGILRALIREKPSMVVVIAAGNDGASLGSADFPCNTDPSIGAKTQAELEVLLTPSFQDIRSNVVIVGNMARRNDLTLPDKLLLPDNDDRRFTTSEFFDGFYALSNPMPVDKVVNTIKLYLQKVGNAHSDKFSDFEARKVADITAQLIGSSDREILLRGEQYDLLFDTFSAMDVRINAELEKEQDEQKIQQLIKQDESRRNLLRTNKIRELKLNLCRDELSREIAELEFTKVDESFDEMSSLFTYGLPKNNSELLKLAREYIPIAFNELWALSPNSARAGALNDIFISAFGTHIPAATLVSNEADERIPAVENFTGTSFAAPIVTGAIALVQEACGLSPKDALSEIYQYAELSNKYWVFGRGKLSIAPIIEKCAKKASLP